MTGPTETTRALAGHTFEMPIRCVACKREFYVPVNLGGHRCEPPPAGFVSPADAQAAAEER